MSHDCFARLIYWSRLQSVFWLDQWARRMVLWHRLVLNNLSHSMKSVRPVREIGSHDGSIIECPAIDQEFLGSNPTPGLRDFPWLLPFLVFIQDYTSLTQLLWTKVSPRIQSLVCFIHSHSMMLEKRYLNTGTLVSIIDFLHNNLWTA